MSPDDPCVQTIGNLAAVNGQFFRAAIGARQAALLGSSVAGRYSRPGQPTLYLSASTDGVAAAMIAHPMAGSDRHVFAFQVDAEGIFDLRLAQALAEVRRQAGDPFADWQTVVAAGGEPPSWRARDWIEQTGAAGLIDPSRQAPGLWHLVLFRWNVTGAPTVT